MLNESQKALSSDQQQGEYRQLGDENSQVSGSNEIGCQHLLQHVGLIGRCGEPKQPGPLLRWEGVDERLHDDGVGMV